MAAVGEAGGAVVEPHLVALALGVGDEGVEIAVAIHIGEGNLPAVTTPQVLVEGEAAGAVVEQYLVGLAVVVGKEGVEIAVAVEITELDIVAVVTVAAQVLGAVDEGNRPRTDDQEDAGREKFTSGEAAEIWKILMLKLVGALVCAPTPSVLVSVTVNVNPSAVRGPRPVVEMKLTRPPSTSPCVNVPLALSAVPSRRISP